MPRRAAAARAMHRVVRRATGDSTQQSLGSLGRRHDNDYDARKGARRRETARDGAGGREMEAGEVPLTGYAREREERARRVWDARQMQGVVVVDEEKAAQQLDRSFPRLARDPEVRHDEPPPPHSRLFPAIGALPSPEERYEGEGNASWIS
ncbi:hypothetical protein EV122DRAFT_285472 [Schizophyllum commune]